MVSMKASTMAVGIGILLYGSVAMASSWQLVPANSSLTFTAIQNNAPITGNFHNFGGIIEFDPDALEKSHIRITVDMTSVEASYGEIVTTLKTADWFDTGQFTTAVFESTSVTHRDGKQYAAEGKLTLKDKTLPVTVNFELKTYTETEADVTGTAKISRTVFGVGKGQWEQTDTVKDPVTVTFDIHAVPVTGK